MTDVLEHVDSPGRAIAEASRLLRPGGRLFVNTFDRNWRSSLAVVHVAEGLGLIPRGTHDPELFVKPRELECHASESGLAIERLVRERPALIKTALSWTIHLREARTGIGYSAFLQKETS
jgi:2-polyprenyl-3-methyl-5-hydroxy-6-metoxy-1,4-benzoquinol methylase